MSDEKVINKHRCSMYVSYFLLLQPSFDNSIFNGLLIAVCDYFFLFVLSLSGYPNECFWCYYYYYFVFVFVLLLLLA